MQFVVVGCSGSFSFFFCQDKNKDVYLKELYRLDPRYLILLHPPLGSCSWKELWVRSTLIVWPKIFLSAIPFIYDDKVVFLSASASPITSLIVSKQSLQLLCIFSVIESGIGNLRDKIRKNGYRYHRSLLADLSYSIDVPCQDTWSFADAGTSSKARELFLKLPIPVVQCCKRNVD